MRPKQLHLIPVEAHELIVLLDALVNYADQLERFGDAMKDAPVCDAISDRVRALRDITSIEAHEFLKQMGLGSYENRPQG
jgi:hypothetical protein